MSAKGHQHEHYQLLSQSINNAKNVIDWMKRTTRSSHHQNDQNDHGGGIEVTEPSGPGPVPMERGRKSSSKRWSFKRLRHSLRRATKEEKRNLIRAQSSQDLTYGTNEAAGGGGGSGEPAASTSHPHDAHDHDGLYPMSICSSSSLLRGTIPATDDNNATETETVIGSLPSPVAETDHPQQEDSDGKVASHRPSANNSAGRKAFLKRVRKRAGKWARHLTIGSMAMTGPTFSMGMAFGAGLAPSSHLHYSAKAHHRGGGGGGHHEDTYRHQYTTPYLYGYGGYDSAMSYTQSMVFGRDHYYNPTDIYSEYHYAY